MDSAVVQIGRGVACTSSMVLATPKYCRTLVMLKIDAVAIKVAGHLAHQRRSDVCLPGTGRGKSLLQSSYRDDTKLKLAHCDRTHS